MLRTLALLLSCSPTCLASTHWIVGPSGSGADFAQVSAAIQAAAPGDSIFVLPGIYSEPAGVRIDKALTLIGAGSPITRIEVPVGGFGCPGLLVIENIAAQDAVSCGGFEIVGTGSGFNFPGCGMFLSDCDGPVFLHDLDKLVGSPNSPEPIYLQVERCADVTLERCSFEGVHYFGDCGIPPWIDARPAVRGVDSRLTLNACDLWGGSPTESCFVVDGAPGLGLLRSTARVANSVLEGSEDRGTLSGLIPGWQGIELEDSSAELFGGTQVQGGLFFQGQLATAVILESGAALTVTDDVTFESSGGNPPIVDPGGLLTTAPERWAAGLVTPGLAPVGSNVSLDLAGEPSALTLTYLGSPQLSTPIGGIEGPLQLAPSDPNALAIVTLDPAGSANVPFTLPNDPALQGSSLAFQTLGVTPTLGLSLSPLFGFRFGY